MLTAMVCGARGIAKCNSTPRDATNCCNTPKRYRVLLTNKIEPRSRSTTGLNRTSASPTGVSADLLCAHRWTCSQHAAHPKQCSGAAGVHGHECQRTQGLGEWAAG
eukprot:2997635-Alexandrium_andersonii.AAC.1